MRLLHTLLILFALGSAAQAQIEVPITENSTLRHYYIEQEKKGSDARRMQLNEGSESGQAKGLQNCNLERAGINYLLAGDPVQLIVDLDTAGVEGGTFICGNCNALNFGSVVLMTDTLTYTGNTGVSAGKDSVLIKYCNAAGTVCSDSTYLYFVVRRAPRDYFPPITTLNAETSTTITANETLLPGPLACNFFVDCAYNYDGRDQRVYFSEYPAPTSSFVYEASRFSGVDSVCYVLCDTFGICDIFHFAVRVRHDTITLPFMDDFSYEGPFTNNRLWLDSDVFVNRTLGFQPPSIGVATFDGVNARGKPYGGDPGEADRLTSTYINLNGVSGNVVLTYWLQRRGLGDRPEIQDSLVLEFRAQNGLWHDMRNYPGAPSSQPNTAEELFQFYAVPVPADFRHKAFQFRFKNYADRQGILDNWNLDYIRLDNIQTDTFINDVAFTELPEPILSRYTSMPWRHFRDNEAEQLSSTLEAGIYNHANQTLNASPSSVTLVEANTGIQPFGPVTLFNGQEANIPNGEYLNRTYSLSGDATGFPNILAGYLIGMQNNAFDGPERLEFNMEYTLSNTSQINQAGFGAVQANDRVARTTVFDEYFAYDDGSAEAGLVTSEGGQIAVRYTANVDDTLRAVRIHFPHTSANVTDQTFRLRVWIGELDGTPEYQALLQPAYADAYFDTLQGFTTYPLKNPNGELAPLYLPAGDFFVGWQQITPCTFTNCIAIGYDKNRPQAKEYISRNSGNGWIELPATTVGGALMIHPVVGDETPSATATDEIPAHAGVSVKVFPNPARDVLNVQLTGGAYHEHIMALYNSVGQLILSGPLTPTLNAGALPPGLYFLHVRHRDGGSSVNKVMVAR